MIPIDASPLIQSGTLRHLIQIQGQTMIPDPVTGAPGSTWTTLRTTRSEIVAKSALQPFLANQFSDQATHLVTIRWSKISLAAGMRVIFGARRFDIQNVENVKERNIRLDLMCQEIDGVIS